jgi:hypothetical protein
MRYVLMLIVLLAAAGCGAGKPKEPVALDQVPDVGLKAAREQLPDVKFERACREPNGDYELIGKDKNGQVREIDVSPSGQVTQVE